MSTHSIAAANHSASIDSDVLERIAQALAGLRYGTVAVTVHDGRVVQIDRTEKLRLVQDGQR